MKILCLGGWGYGNLGDEFILRGTLAGIKLALKDAQVTVASFNPETTRKWHRVDAIPSLHRQTKGKNKRTARLVSFGRIWGSLLLSNYTKHVNLLHLAEETCSNFDLVIQAGGGYFNDLFLLGYPNFALELLGAIHSTAKVAMIGQTIGPFTHLLGARQASLILKQVPFIFVRDDTSIQVLSNLGVDHARRCADSALLVGPGDFRRTNSSEGCLVVFVQRPRGFVAETGLHGGQMNHEQLLDSLAKILKDIAILEDVEILITTSIISEVTWKMCEELALRLVNRYGYTNVKTHKPTSPQDVCDALSNAKVCISMNMHPLIMASIMRIPCVGISYSWKLEQFMKESLQTRQTVPLNVSAQKFQELLRAALLDSLHLRDDEKSSIHDAIVRLKYCALVPFERLAAL
jgi:polysaccharide pyruvyl transferase WcaK-like protein